MNCSFVDFRRAHTKNTSCSLSPGFIWYCKTDWKYLWFDSLHIDMTCKHRWFRARVCNQLWIVSSYRLIDTTRVLTFLDNSENDFLLTIFISEILIIHQPWSKYLGFKVNEKWSFFILQVGFILNKSKRKKEIWFATLHAHCLFLFPTRKKMLTLALLNLFIETVLCCSFRRRSLGFGFEGAVADHKRNASGQPHHCGEGRRCALPRLLPGAAKALSLPVCSPSACLSLYKQAKGQERSCLKQVYLC